MKVLVYIAIALAAIGAIAGLSFGMVQLAFVSVMVEQSYGEAVGVVWLLTALATVAGTIGRVLMGDKA